MTQSAQDEQGSSGQSSPGRGSADLVWTEDGAPRSARFGDVYFSREDGLAETRAVFLDGCGLPEAWRDRRQVTVAELGFGSGLNVVALLELWAREKPAEGRLTIFTVEAFPMSAAEAERALSAWPELASLTKLLIASWPTTPGFHRIDLPALNAVIDVAIGDVDWALGQWRGQADAWFLDGFAPATNPDMWSSSVFAAIAARSRPGARLATFTVAGAVRRGLAEVGFAVEKKPGHGRKRERLEARLPGAVASATPPRVAVIGAGIAGASVVRALAASGVTPTLIEAEGAGAGASGFPAALVTPRLDVGDAAMAGLYAQALFRAGDLYGRTPGAVIARGVLQLEGQARDAARFDKVAEQPIWPDGVMRRRGRPDVDDRIGEPAGSGALEMGAALTVRPSAVLEEWLSGADRVAGRAATLAQSGGRWSVLDGAGETLAEADAVVVAAGWGAAELTEALHAGPRLSPVRGQADWADGPTSEAVAWGGYAAPTGSGTLFGATHDRDGVATEVRAEDSARNLATLEARLPALAGRIASAPRRARAAVRATTADRLPVCGELRPGLWILGGLGSRGFCLSPLLGEHVASVLLGAPSPLPAGYAKRLSPHRSSVAKAPLAS